ncbi:MAG: hypothetical protein HOC71_07905 [Candidatus Latescibacteria bacterium]|jgi:hypothetical protein|nr:hypothetical protein [Candidatus Latescibacterota bacterium]
MNNKTKDSDYLNKPPRNFGNIELEFRPFYHTDIKNTLENIEFTEKKDSEKGILEKVFSDKSKTLKTTVKSLLNEIELRENIDSHLLRKINDEICRFHTHLMHIENIKVQYFPDSFADVNKIKMQFENEILELEKEKRNEYLECWRDLMFLKKYLLVAFKEYWDVVKKREMLEGDVSELINNEILK